jgi:4-amino-4-deoxy-L-arabinose transferase-like glycosyltransferase
VAGFARLNGSRVDAWAVRLPAALAAMACVLVIFFLGICTDRLRTGFTAAGVLATAVHFTWLARVGRIDMPLTLAINVALSGYYLGRQSRKKVHPWRWAVWLLLAYLAVAAGLLLKGPIALVLPGAVIGVHLLVCGDLTANRPPRTPLWRHLAGQFHALGLWWGLPLVAALTLPWFLLVNERTQGQFFRMFFWYHNIERGFGGSGKLAEHPWWFYGPCLIRDFLPWSPALLLAGWLYLRQPRRRADPLATFGFVWLTTMFILLSFMKFKRSDYLLPAFPGAVLLVASVAAGWLRERNAVLASSTRRRAARVAILGCLGATIVAGCVAGWYFYVAHYLPSQEHRHQDRQFAAAIRQRLAPRQPVIFFCTKAHLLTFHLGKPVDTLLEWENLDWWAARPDTYVVTTPALAQESIKHLKAGRLVEVLRSTALSENGKERTLLLVRAQPCALAH